MLDAFAVEGGVGPLLPVSTPRDLDDYDTTLVSKSLEVYLKWTGHWTPFSRCPNSAVSRVVTLTGRSGLPVGLSNTARRKSTGWCVLKGECVAFSEFSDPLFGGVMPLLHSCLSFWLHSGASGLLVARDHLRRARADAP